MDSPLGKLQSFLDGYLPGKIPGEEGDSKSLRAFVEQNFDLMDEAVLRALVAAALKDREELAKSSKEGPNAEALLGTWGVVIDTVREVTGERQERAGRNFQAIMATAKEGQPKLVATALSKLYREQQIDRLFIDLLDSTLEECRKAGHAEYVAMLTFFREVIDKNKAVADSLKARAAGSTPPAAPGAGAGASGTTLSPPLPAPPAAKAKAKDVAPFPLGAPPTNRVEELDSDDEEEDDEEEDEEEEEEEELPSMDEGVSSASSVSPFSQAATDTLEPQHSQETLLQAGTYLTSLLEQYKGDAAALRDRMQSDLCQRRLPFATSALRRVVGDHLAAATQAGYVNRVQFMRFVLDRVLRPVDEAEERRAAGGIEGEGVDELELGETTYHAPKFVDELRGAGAGAGVGAGADAGAARLNVVTPEKFISAEGVAMGGGASSGGAGKSVGGAKAKGSKALKKEQRRMLGSLAKKMGAQLQTQGWSCCDNFLSEDLIRRVRIEAGLFSEYYEQSEIWVGKQADVGTLLSVPSVRGDKVIWMCGGHKNGSAAAPEGDSRAVKTIGEIEPCRLEAKARAPLRKFSALKALVSSCDRLIDGMKKVVPDMAGIFERSDAMMANYPGGGSRFARHIDNTTQDGRRVTLLVYLNPGWAQAQGGALRLSAPIDSARTSEGPGTTDVYPCCGRLVIFYSATIPHEVMPTYGDRHAITLWYYDKEERAAAMSRAKESGRAEAVARAGTDAQREAKAFIADLMGGDDVDAEGGEPTREELQALAHKVQDLSAEAVGIVSSITGAPSAQSFRTGFEMLVPQDLKQMRQLFRRMGLHE